MPTMSVFCLGGKDRKVASSRPVGVVPNSEGEEREKTWRKRREDERKSGDTERKGIHKMIPHMKYQLYTEKEISGF